MQSVLIDSLQKVFGDRTPRPADPVAGVHASGFLGETLSVQVAVLLDEGDPPDVRIRLGGNHTGRAEASVVRRVPVSTPCPDDPDEHYLATTPGDYPDLLEPVAGDVVRLVPGVWEAFWLDAVGAEASDAGERTLIVTVTDADGGVLTEQTALLRIHPHRLPPLAITNTHWFHADSLSTYHGVEVFSERHWELIEAHLASARAMDVNSVLTPVWTPPLDTAVGRTRPLVQLVGVRDEDGAYAFDFARLDRWLELCGRLGFTGLEMAHLFTQWGSGTPRRSRSRPPRGPSCVSAGTWPRPTRPTAGCSSR